MLNGLPYMKREKAEQSMLRTGPEKREKAGWLPAIWEWEEKEVPA